MTDEGEPGDGAGRADGEGTAPGQRTAEESPDGDGADGQSDTLTTLAERRGLDDAVYGASDDSALLAGAALDAVGAGDRVLDVGTGSGYVGGRIADETDAAVVATDLNPHACGLARERGLETVRADLVAPFADGAFDAVVFNPPYLPTPEDGPWDDWMEVALSGGESGRKVVGPFLESVGRVLAPEGVALLLVSSVTGLEEILALAERVGLSVAEVAEENHSYERLVVLALRERAADPTEE